MRIVDAPVGSELWRYLHVGTIGGACFQTIMANGKGRDTFLKQKIKERQTWESSLPCQAVLQGNRGALLEPHAIELYESGWDIKETQQCIVINEYIVISPDVLNYNLFSDSVSGAEVKCYGLDKHNEIIKKGEMPNSDKGQLQGYIGYLEAEFWDYVLYHPQAKKKKEQFRIEPDFDYIAELKEKVDLFIHELKTGADLNQVLKQSIKDKR